MDNASYKLVALFVTLILWITIFGRRDFQLTREMDIEYLIPPGMSLVNPELPHRVTVRVSGPRLALKRFSQGPGLVAVDLSRSRAGKVKAVISPKQIDVPFGVKVLSITPELFELTLETISK